MHTKTHTGNQHKVERKLKTHAGGRKHISYSFIEHDFPSQDGGIQFILHAVTELLSRSAQCQDQSNVIVIKVINIASYGTTIIIKTYIMSCRAGQ